MDIRLFDQTGATNEYLGVLFTVHKQGNRYILDFIVKELPMKNGAPLSIKMHPEQNHKRSHVHIYRRKEKLASVSLNGEFLVGGQTLSSNEKSKLLFWLSSNQEPLQDLWRTINQGESHDTILSKIQGQWQYRGIVFKGTKPEKETIVEGVHLWHNGDLSYTLQENGTIKIVCTNDVCAYVPKENEIHEKALLFECPNYQCKTEV